MYALEVSHAIQEMVTSPQSKQKLYLYVYNPNLNEATKIEVSAEMLVLDLEGNILIDMDG